MKDKLKDELRSGSVPFPLKGTMLTGRPSLTPLLSSTMECKPSKVVNHEIEKSRIGFSYDSSGNNQPVSLWTGRTRPGRHTHLAPADGDSCSSHRHACPANSYAHANSTNSYAQGNDCYHQSQLGSYAGTIFLGRENCLLYFRDKSHHRSERVVRRPDRHVGAGTIREFQTTLPCDW